MDPLNDSPLGDATGHEGGGHTRAARRFGASAVVAVAVAAIPYLWVLWDLWTSRVNPLRIPPQGAGASVAYDVQARSILHGGLSIPPGSIGPEAFLHNGSQYTYFGLFPSLLRLPIVGFTHSLDGRLTAVSMLVAWLATAVFASLLLWRIRIVVRGDVALGWAETCSYGLLLFSVLVGSVLLFLASEPNEYSEDLTWSVALACGTLFTLLGVVERPSWRRVVACGVLLVATNLNRATTGYACIIGAFLIALWFAVGRDGKDRRRWALPLLAATLLAALAGCAVDLAKFGLLFGIPVSSQELYKEFGFARINGGHYYSLRYIPSTLQAYVDPRSVRFTSVFPFITLPDVPAVPVDHTALFSRTPTASVIVSMPLLFVTGLWGVVTACMRQHRAVVRSLRILLLAAAATAAVEMIDGWVVERFVGDFMPLLVLASAIGMVDVWRRMDGKGRPARVVLPCVLSLLGLFGLAANIGFAVTPVYGWNSAQLARFVGEQKTISDATNHDLSRDVVRGTSFPANAPAGELYIRGDCQALYVADQVVRGGTALPTLTWLTVERAPHTPLCHQLLPVATQVRPAGGGPRVTSPSDGADVSGPSVIVTARGSGPTVFESVSLLVVATPRLGVSDHEMVGRHGSWTYDWNTLSVRDGEYELRTISHTATGQVDFGPVVTVTVVNHGR